MRSDAGFSLNRFHEAHNQRHSGYDQALAEIRAGRKRGHWIWYVLPQVNGLGQSSMSRTYAIAGRGEAEAYLRDALLSARYLEITTAIAEQLMRGVGFAALMGSTTDAQKLASSLTLFGDVAGDMSAQNASRRSVRSPSGQGRC